MVLLPASILTGTPPEMLDAIIAHELAHIRRLDLWVNLLQRIVETLLFYHPAVWWVSARLREQREICCDEIAVRVTGQRLEYASMLERMAQLLSRPVQLAATLLPRRSLLGRVRHVLGLPAQRGRTGWIGGPAAAAVVIALVVAIVSCSRAQNATRPATAPAQPATTRPAAAKPDFEEIAKHDVTMRNLLAQIQNVSEALVRQSQQYGEQHPQIQQLKQRLNELETAIEERSVAYGKLARETTTAQSDVQARLQEKILQRINALQEVKIKLSLKLRDLSQEIRDKCIKLSIDGMGTPGRISAREIELADMLKRQFDMEQSIAQTEAAISQFKANQEKGKLDPSIAEKVERDPRLAGYVQQIDEIDLKLAENGDKVEAERLAKRKLVLQKKADERAAELAASLGAARSDELNNRLATDTKSLAQLKESIAMTKQELGDLTYELNQYVTAKDEEKSIREYSARLQSQMDRLRTMSNLPDLSDDDLRAFDRAMLGLDEKQR